MEFSIINSPITDRVISALCNTLVHSLWQGLLLSAVTGLIIIFTRKASAAIRYNLLITALLIFAAGVALTFSMQFKRVGVTATNDPIKTVQTALNIPAPAIQQHVPVVTTDLTGRVSAYLNNHHNTIVLIWFLIICAKSVQLGIGLLGVHHLKRNRVTLADPYWADRVQQLAHRLHIKQGVALLGSGLAKVPMVIGNLKPVILIPIGLLTALSAEEVEAILIHELAHIKRRDYLVNLLQSLMEIIFFFNPAVLWVSQLIKAERENCCDDLALAQNSDRVSYIRALLTCEEYQQAVPAYAMGFPGGKGTLIDRVKRLASNRNHSLNLFEKTVLAVCLVASGLCFSAFAEKDKLKHTLQIIVKNIQQNNVENTTREELANNTAELKRQTALLDKQSALKRPVLQQLVPPVLTAQAPKLNDIIIAQRPDTDSLVNLKIRTFKLHPKLKLDSLKPHLKPMNSRLNRLNAETDSVNVNTNVQTNVNADVRTNVNTRVNLNLKVDTTFKNSLAMNNIDAKRTTYNSKFTQGLSPNLSYTISGRSPYTSIGKFSARMPDKADSSVNRLKLANKLNLKLNIPKMGDALYNAGLIKDKGAFTALLTNDELIVNGVKQSEENHQRILKLYQKKPGDKVNLSFTYPGK